MARRYVSQAERRTEGARYDRAERLLQRAIDDQKRGGSGAAEEGWHVVGDPGEPGLINPWLKWGDPSMRFKKIANLVYVQFYLMQGSPTPAQIFTLPVGYRPTYEVNFIVGLVDPSSVVRVTQAGVLYCDFCGTGLLRGSIEFLTT